MNRVTAINTVGTAMQKAIDVEADPEGDYDIAISSAAHAAVDVLWPEIERLRTRTTEQARELERRDALLPDLERRYVEALNAILAVPGERESDDDLNRWRGHAEAYRQVCERLRVDAGLAPVRYTSAEWRGFNGVREPISR